MIKDHPIIMSLESSEAILELRKTQTRRVLNPQPMHNQDVFKDGWTWVKGKNSIVTIDEPPNEVCLARNPYGKVGDYLWVREKCYEKEEWVTGDHISYEVIYGEGYPAIYMPKDLCRIWLRITGLRVEKLQDISLYDACAEGVRKTSPDSKQDGFQTPFEKGSFTVGEFATVWDKFNAKRRFSWENNPWVWVVTFEKIPKPSPILDRYNAPTNTYLEEENG